VILSAKFMSCFSASGAKPPDLAGPVSRWGTSFPQTSSTLLPNLTPGDATVNVYIRTLTEKPEQQRFTMKCRTDQRLMMLVGWMESVVKLNS